MKNSSNDAFERGLNALGRDVRESEKKAFPPTPAEIESVKEFIRARDSQNKDPNTSLQTLKGLIEGAQKGDVRISSESASKLRPQEFQALLESSVRSINGVSRHSLLKEYNEVRPIAGESRAAQIVAEKVSDVLAQRERLKEGITKFKTKEKQPSKEQDSRSKER